MLVLFGTACGLEAATLTFSARGDDVHFIGGRTVTGSLTWEIPDSHLIVPAAGDRQLSLPRPVVRVDGVVVENDPALPATLGDSHLWMTDNDDEHGAHLGVWSQFSRNLPETGADGIHVWRQEFYASASSSGFVVPSFGTLDSGLLDYSRAVFVPEGFDYTGGVYATVLDRFRGRPRGRPRPDPRERSGGLPLVGSRLGAR